MLPPLFLSVRAPTLLVSLWRSLMSEKFEGGVLDGSPRSFIIFRLDAMGDVVMTTPLFRELKRAFPKSHCTVVVRRALRPLLVTNPYIDEILTPPKVRLPFVPRRSRALLAAWMLYWSSLRGRRFDVAISPRWDLDEHLATLLCLMTNAARRVGYTEKTSPLKQRLNRGFDTAFNICLAPGAVRHEVVRNLVVLEALGGTVQDSRLEVRPTERDRAFASGLLASTFSASKVIALGIGAATAGRRWPLQRYAEVISRLMWNCGVLPVIVCSASEGEQAVHLAKLLPRKPVILSGAPLREVCALLERCHLFIGNDSGAAHLAAAMDCKTIVISRHPRNGDPNHANSPLRFGPYCSQARILQPTTGLDGCSDCCRAPEPHCITAVSVEDVVAAAHAMLCGQATKVHWESTNAADRLPGSREVPLSAMARRPDGIPFGGLLTGRG
jgi:heptosyltransferase-2